MKVGSLSSRGNVSSKPQLASIRHRCKYSKVRPFSTLQFSKMSPPLQLNSTWLRQTVSQTNSFWLNLKKSYHAMSISVKSSLQSEVVAACADSMSISESVADKTRGNLCYHLFPLRPSRHNRYGLQLLCSQNDKARQPTLL